ncbi:hypothetical protein [Xanthomonas cerealis]|uniref:hypothetical protein n=1 Tax=Xanthomonas cerealis TaxID=3390025 RepID=UPI0021B04D7D|nr:hypothetical protein [Xanthomonas translucens]
MKPPLFRRLAVAALAAIALPAAAQSAGHFTTNYGIHGMVPGSSNGTLSGSEQRFSADATPAVSFATNTLRRGQRHARQGQARSAHLRPGLPAVFLIRRAARRAPHGRGLAVAQRRDDAAMATSSVPARIRA